MLPFRDYRAIIDWGKNHRTSRTDGAHSALEACLPSLLTCSLHRRGHALLLGPVEWRHAPATRHAGREE